MMSGCYIYFNSEKNINSIYLNQFQNKILGNSTKRVNRKASDIHIENHNNYLTTQNNQSIKEYTQTPIIHKRSNLFSPYSKQTDKDSSGIIISDLDLNDKKNNLMSGDDKIKRSKTTKLISKSSVRSKINKFKKVTFKKRFVSIIKVESYKAYNAELLSLRYNIGNDKASLNCTCTIL